MGGLTTSLPYLGIYIFYILSDGHGWLFSSLCGWCRKSSKKSRKGLLLVIPCIGYSIWGIKKYGLRILDFKEYSLNTIQPILLREYIIWWKQSFIEEKRVNSYWEGLKITFQQSFSAGRGQCLTISLVQLSRREREFLPFSLVFETRMRISFFQSRVSRKERKLLSFNLETRTGISFFQSGVERESR